VVHCGARAESGRKTSGRFKPVPADVKMLDGELVLRMRLVGEALGGGDWSGLSANSCGTLAHMWQRGRKADGLTQYCCATGSSFGARRVTLCIVEGRGGLMSPSAKMIYNAFAAEFGIQLVIVRAKCWGRSTRRSRL